MELPKLSTSKKYDRRINLDALDKSKINEGFPFGGISQKSVELRHAGLRAKSVMDDLEKPGVKVDYKTVKMLTHMVLAKTHALSQSYATIDDPKKYVKAPFSTHDIDRARAALGYQNDRLREIMKFMETADMKGKSPAEALDEMAVGIFDKDVDSDNWSGGRRINIENPIAAAQNITRPTEHRVVKKFFETVLDNVYAIDAQVAKMMPVVDYGLAKYEESLKPAKGSRRLPKPSKQPKLSSELEDQILKVSEQTRELPDLAKNSLQRNVERVDSYLDALGKAPGLGDLASRKDVLLEDIFQLTKARIETTATDSGLSDDEVRVLFKKAVLDGVANFEKRLNAKIAENKVSQFLERAGSEQLEAVERPKPQRPKGNNFGMLKAYAQAKAMDG